MRLLGNELGHEARFHDDPCSGNEPRRLGMVVAAEPEDRRRAPAERLEQVRHRRDPDSAPRRAAAARRRVGSRCRAGRRRGSRRRLASAQSAWVPGPIASSRNASSPGGAWQRLIGRGSTRPGASSMKNWPGTPGSSPPTLEPEQRVRPDRLVRDDRKSLAARVHASIPMRSCSESADSARAFAIACTAAAAPEIVVTQGTRATSAASRMR